jgi:epsilon-lactone hydrolase
MPSLAARLAGFILRTTGTYRRNFTGGEQLQKQIALARSAPIAEPTAKMRAKLDVREDSFEGRAVWHVGPKGQTSSTRILFFHGGGYIYSAAPPHWDFVAHMAGVHGLSFIVPLYPLAPENDAVTTTAFGLALYRDLVSRHGAARLVVGGDSAGGGLTAAVLQLAAKAEDPLPSGVILVCPWLNADPAHPDQLKIEKRDAILTVSGIRDAGKLYARGLPTADLRISPIHGDFDPFPATLMFGGGDDLLVVDARALRAKRPATDYVEEPGLIHDWPLFAFPESRRAQARIAAFVSEVVPQ